MISTTRTAKLMMMKSLMVLLLLTHVVSSTDAKPVPGRPIVRVNPAAQITNSRDWSNCSSACDGNYMVCANVIRNFYEHFICLKVRSGCKHHCRHPDLSGDVIITPLSLELDKIWNTKS